MRHMRSAVSQDLPPHRLKTPSTLRTFPSDNLVVVPKKKPKSKAAEVWLMHSPALFVNTLW